MSRTELIAQAFATFCHLHGIDPEQSSAQEFRATLFSELSGVILGLPGCSAQYIKNNTATVTH